MIDLRLWDITGQLILVQYKTEHGYLVLYQN